MREKQARRLRQLLKYKPKPWFERIYQKVPMFKAVWFPGIVSQEKNDEGEMVNVFAPPYKRMVQTGEMITCTGLRFKYLRAKDMINDSRRL